MEMGPIDKTPVILSKTNVNMDMIQPYLNLSIILMHQCDVCLINRLLMEPCKVSISKHRHMKAVDLFLVMHFHFWG